MRGWFAAALLMTVVTGEARAQGADERNFCTTLRRVLGAASERPAFASLGRRGTARAAAGLGFDTCRIVPDIYGARLACSLANPRNARLALDARIARCVPEALRMSEPGNSLLSRFRLGTLAFHVMRRPGAVDFTLFAMPIERR